VEDAEAAQALAARGGTDYPVLLTPRDTAGEKAVEVFRGRGEMLEPLNFASLEALRPAPIDPRALAAAVDALEDLVAGRGVTEMAEVEAVIGRVLPGFAHVAAEARLDDRI